MTSSAHRFLAESARYLRDVHFPRLERAVRRLRPEDLWWRPHEGTISVGVILLHLEGNVRQWILSGLGGEADHRERSREFATEGGPGLEELVERLRDTVLRAAEVIEGIDADSLVDARTIQGMDSTVQDAIYHVVEHFSWHTGQAVWIVKARGGTGHGIAFYDDRELDAARNP